MSQYAGDVRIVPADLFPVYRDLLPVAQRRPASGLVRPLSGPTDPNCLRSSSACFQCTAPICFRSCRRPDRPAFSPQLSDRARLLPLRLRDVRIVQKKLSEVIEQIQWIHREQSLYKQPLTEYPDTSSTQPCLPPGGR